MTNPAHTPQLPTGAWSVALRGKLTQEATARIGPDASKDRKCEVMAELVAKLQALREYDRFDRRQLESVVAKCNYREVGKIDVGSIVEALHVLPDGKIVCGSRDGTIRIWTYGPDGKWSSEELRGQTNSIRTLQALPDGRIVSGSFDDTIWIWSKGVEGQWSSEILKGHTDWVTCVQALPDGTIVSGSGDRTIRIWTKGADGEWSSEKVLGDNGGVECLQALPDGRIVSGSSDKTIRIWTKDADGQWSSEEIAGHDDSVSCLQVLPDGRIVSGSSDDNTIQIWSKDADGKWSYDYFRGSSDWIGPEDLPVHMDGIGCLQVLPDGRIVAGWKDGTVRIWTKKQDSSNRGFVRGLVRRFFGSQWDCEVLRGHSQENRCLQVLPDGRIFSGSDDGTIRIWDGDQLAGDES